ncbi:MAG TPA: Zn-ribbon domain-containing OB-fold protein [Actinomycetes bacterium]|nr:Zn-ribbon domain-containing OB-fold protein [Actinomycetes bacterium]
MSGERGADGARVPRPPMLSTPATAPYWAAAAVGRLLLQRCRSCGRLQHYARTLCAGCWSEDLDWVEAAGTGTVWTLTVAHVPGHPAWAAAAPYVLAIVELDEGPRLLTNVVGVPPQSVAVGQRVRLVRHTDSCPEGDPALLQFTPLESVNPNEIKEIQP